MSLNLEQENDRLNSKIMMLTRDLDRKHRECAELQKQLSVLSEHVLRDEFIVDYAIWQAIHDLESRCRHYPTGLEIKVQDKANSVPVEYALKLLEWSGLRWLKTTIFRMSKSFMIRHLIHFSAKTRLNKNEKTNSGEF